MRCDVWVRALRCRLFFLSFFFIVIIDLIITPPIVTKSHSSPHVALRTVDARPQSLHSFATTPLLVIVFAPGIPQHVSPTRKKKNKLESKRKKQTFFHTRDTYIIN